jgi:hypothetical protein
MLRERPEGSGEHAGAQCVREEADMSRSTSFVASLAVTALGSGAFADEIRVPQQYPTVEVAEMAASPGDRIVVRGTLPDIVRLTAPGVTLDLTRARLESRLEVSADGAAIVGGRLRRGIRVIGRNVRLVGTKVTNAGSKSAAVPVPAIEILESGATLDAVRVRAPRNEWVDGVAGDGAGLTIRRSTFAGGTVGVHVTADDTDVSASRFTGQKEAGVILEGDASRVADSTFERTPGTAIVGIGDGAEVVGNTVRGAAEAILASGAGPTIEANRVDATWTAIDVSASGGATVRGNEVLCSGGARGIRTRGDAVVLSDNVVRGENADTSIHVEGDGCTVTGNTVERSGRPAPGAMGSGILVRGNGAVVSGNGVSDTESGYYGVWTDGTDNEISANQVTGCGSGIVVCGCRNLIASNEVRDAGLDGIVVVGAESVVEDPDVAGAGRCGVLLYGATQVVGGFVRGSGDGGIVALADGSTVDACGLDRNRTGDVVALESCAVTGVDADTRIVTDPAAVPELVEVRDAGFSPPWPVPFPVVAGD